jgi:hypothetical protein
MSHDPERRSGAAPAAAVHADATPSWLRGSISARDHAPAPALWTGHLAGLDDDGRLLFVPEGESEPIPVTIGIELSDGVLVRAARRKRRALVARTADPTPRWILVGLVRERVAARARDARPGRLEVEMDGEKVRLEAQHDIELRCGQASITLRYDGRIEVRGTHILSASRGPNRVKGATVALN